MSGEKADIAARILPWYLHHGRKNLPWQQSKDAYRIWVSEIMLQQTQVTTVLGYYARFIDRFPSVKLLAQAEIDHVLALWSGLGYYARARNLHKAAQVVMIEHRGRFPKNFESVHSLPGIGRSTAGAILAFSTGQRFAILDGNVKRVLARYYAIQGYPGKRKIENRLWELADLNTPNNNVAEYTQAIMDLGASVCVRRNPNCTSCPLESLCQARLQGIERTLPSARPRKDRPVKEIAMLIIIDAGKRILLEKRPPAGIWGGLWSLPESRPEKKAIYEQGQMLGLSVESDALELIEHDFSHFRLRIFPYLCRVGMNITLKDDNHYWHDVSKIDQLGLPKPVKSLIEKARELNE